MVSVLGEHDEFLRLIEDAFDARVLVRGNEITVTGESGEADKVARLFEEMVEVIRQGQAFDRDQLDRSIEMMQAGGPGPQEVLTERVLSSGGRTIRPKSAGQKAYADAMTKDTVVFSIGPAGTGKTYLAVAAAVRALREHDVRRILLTRPAVEAGEKLGFLPGDLLAKIDPYLRPLYDALYDMLEPDAVQRLIDRGTIEIAPLAYMRGRTLNDSFIILDEAQNTSPEQMKMFLTRLGFGSRAVITGDVTQIDLPQGHRSGLVELEPILGEIEGVSFVHLGGADVVRHRIVRQIVEAYAKHETESRRARPGV